MQQVSKDVELVRPWSGGSPAFERYLPLDKRKNGLKKVDTYQSENFGGIALPESFEDLLSLFDESRPEEINVRIWRGQGDIGWKIHSSAYRRLALRAGEVDERRVRIYEERLIEQADHRGFRHFQGRELNDVELLARLQHHGAATRLVDARRSALVALWFAVASRPNATGALIGIHTHHVGGYEGRSARAEYFELLDSFAKKDYPFTWEPTTVSPRIAAQHSQFLISRIANNPQGSLCLPREGTLVVGISPELKKRTQDTLVSSSI